MNVFQGLIGCQSSALCVRQTDSIAILYATVVCINNHKWAFLPLGGFPPIREHLRCFYQQIMY